MWGDYKGNFLKDEKDKQDRDKKVNVKRIITKRLDQSFEDIEKAYYKLVDYSNRGQGLPQASEWILNDFYLIRLKYIRLKLNLKKEKKIVLNIMKYGSLKGYPRIYVLALELINDTKGEITEEKIIKFIKDFQVEEILTLEELSRLQDVLAFALIEYIRDIVLIIVNKIETQIEVDSRDLSIEANIEEIIDYVNVLNATEIESLVKKIKREREDAKAIIELIDTKLNYMGKSIKKIMEIEYMNQSKYNVTLGYGIKSIRSISNMNWSAIIDEISFVERTYSEDPTEIYMNMEKSSKNYYKFKTQELAEKFKVQEVFIAERALEFAKEQWDSGVRDKRAHIGYYLIR